jgi:hypothetical protein
MKGGYHRPGRAGGRVRCRASERPLQRAHMNDVKCATGRMQHANIEREPRVVVSNVLPVRNARAILRHGKCNLQHVSMQPAHATTSVVRHETGSVQRSTSQMQQLATTTYNPRRHPTCSTHHSTCNVRYATYASDGEGHEHTHTHTQCNRSHAWRSTDGAAIPTVWVSFLAWARRATTECGGAEAANKQTNSRSRSTAADGRRQWHAAARLQRRDHAALGRGSGCAEVLVERR